MLFNAVDFAIFLPIVFILYWFVTNKKLKWQNALLLISSYFFYSCWDWRFLFLLIFSTLLDFYTGLRMQDSALSKNRKRWFWASVIINLGFLGVFKYYNFFAESFSELVSNFGMHIDPWALSVILPVGISFYTFHGLSYVIDIYKNRIDAERNFVDYAVFVSFFPLLVAGPIERATHLLPQIKQARSFEYSKALDGLRQILWGLFKKVVIADSCAEHANMIFSNSADYSGSTLFLGAIFFAFQIYGDFSGYSDIALGTARLFGIELLRNFSYPYFSRDIAEFWRRWHISLSTWFRDYLYIPLGGNSGGDWLRIRNTFIIFLVSGFWHGANWTFLVWGALNALFIMPSIVMKTNRKNLEIVAKGKMVPKWDEVCKIILTFILTTFAWVFFRAENLEQAINYVFDTFKHPGSYLELGVYLNYTTTICAIIVFVLIEWLGREEKYAIEKMGLTWPRWIRHLFYYSLILSIFWFSGKDQQFIYFQF
jgi:alginate O-acetyltransferase complex protein AlgI